MSFQLKSIIGGRIKWGVEGRDGNTEIVITSFGIFSYVTPEGLG